MTDPDHALECCREIGFAEDVWLHDVRAGRCQIETLTSTLVILVTEDGEPTAIDGASTLYESYRKGGIKLAEAP